MTENTEDTPVPQRPRVLSGMRPTGRLHLGNYMGALYHWVQLQHRYECYFFVADYHALTTDYADLSKLKENIREVILDFLAAGLDPDLCTIFIQSRVPAHFELNVLLGMITPVTWLERVPTYKDQQEQLKEKDLATYGFLGYPVLQSADILAYQANLVPVGKDQEAHVEITREIARRFNHLYPRKVSEGQALPGGLIAVWEGFKNSLIYVLPVPRVLLTASPKLPGTDGRKMSKSYHNTILLSDPEPEVRAKLKTMVTDPARIRRTDPGNPDICPVFDLHKVFSTEETQLKVREGCTTAGIGCIQCKGWLADAVVRELAPIQERRRHFEAHPEEVNAIIEKGNAAANKRANQTMQEVRIAMGLR
jgi:tryptophanyl-tRNA synthetase